MSFDYTPSGMGSAAAGSPWQYANQDTGTTVLDHQLARTNDLNVPFSTRGYRDAKQGCNLPKWPPSQTRLYPVFDNTVDTFPIHDDLPYRDVNTYEDILTKATSDTCAYPDPAAITDTGLRPLTREQLHAVGPLPPPPHLLRPPPPPRYDSPMYIAPPVMPAEAPMDRVRRHLAGVVYDLQHWEDLDDEQRSVQFIFARDGRETTCGGGAAMLVVALLLIVALCSSGSSGSYNSPPRHRRRRRRH